jgi:hypothetical protein
VTSADDDAAAQRARRSGAITGADDDGAGSAGFRVGIKEWRS